MPFKCCPKSVSRICIDTVVKFVSRVTMNYVVTLQSKLFSIGGQYVTSLSLLGRPAGLLGNLRSDLSNFINEPLNALANEL